VPDGAEDVMGILAQQIETRFQMPFADLSRAVAAAPQANREATQVVHWYSLLTEAQQALEQAEERSRRSARQRPGELDDPAMDLAHQVNAAVTARDGRAMVVRYLLDPSAPGKRGPGAWRGAAPGVGRGAAPQTSPPTLPVTPSVPMRAATR
jgi:hypothetical protein